MKNERAVGRPRRDVPLDALADAYRLAGSVRGAARALDIPPGTAWDRLRELGMLAINVSRG